ncbi:hypothetical protein, partial [Acinetobacter baumannii]|uniref:hypothetical protein n=1 Tax=Acinetobacter baumannii TaxID=470 RepID=UPI001FB2A218
MGSCAAPSAKGDDKFITTDYLQQCLLLYVKRDKNAVTLKMSAKYRHAKTAQNGVLAYLGFIVAMILSRNDA